MDKYKVGTIFDIGIENEDYIILYTYEENNKIYLLSESVELGNSENEVKINQGNLILISVNKNDESFEVETDGDIIEKVVNFAIESENIVL